MPLSDWEIMVPDFEAPSTLAHRIVRWLAVLGFIDALISLTHALIDVVTGNIWGWYATYLGRNAYIALHFISILSLILLLVASVGLYRWKGWARGCLLAWAPIYVATSLSMNITTLYSLHIAFGSSTQPSRPSLSYYAMMSGVNFVLNTLFPATLFFLLLQREVRDIWSRKLGSGFEVLPVEPVEKLHH